MADCTNENWVQIRDFPNYKISDFGRIRNNTTGVILKPNLDGWGYPKVSLCSNGKKHTKKSHRLVAECFIENTDDKPEVNHKNGNKLDNRVVNLEWVTKSENNMHKCRVLGKKAAKEQQNKAREKAWQSTRKKIICVETKIVYESISEAAKQLKLHQSSISNNLRGCSQTCGGYHFNYYKE